MADLYKVRPEIWELDDERVNQLQSGAITQAEFMRLIRPTDPFELQNGELVLLTEADIKNRADGYIQMRRSSIINTGGLHPNAIYDNKDAFIKVYPELKDQLAVADAAIQKENCKGCARNKHLGPILESLLKLMPGNRDFTVLEPLLTKLPYALLRLKGEAIDINTVSIEIPEGLKKQMIPRKSGMLTKPLAAQPFEYVPGTYVQPENTLNITREGCIDCVRKHLSQAYILFEESLQGYSEARGYIHTSLALGHLAEAADECIKVDPVLAEQIRALRVRVMNQKKNV